MSHQWMSSFAIVGIACAGILGCVDSEQVTDDLPPQCKSRDHGKSLTGLSEHKLLPPHLLEDSSFGENVDISGDLAVVASWSKYDAPGVVYVFEQVGGSWQVQTQLVPDDYYEGMHLGRAVAIDGDVVVIGAPGDRKAYVFERSGGSWIQAAMLLPSNPGSSSSFGRKLAFEGDTIMISGGSPVGAAVYVFERNTDGSWPVFPNAMLRPPDEIVNGYGEYSIDMSGDTAIIGATSVYNAPVVVPGVMYVYERIGGTWTEVDRLTGSDVAPISGDVGQGDRYGTSVAIDGDIAIAGADNHDALAEDGGAAYVFERVNGTWSETAKLMPTTADPNDWYGTAVAVSGERLVVVANCTNDLGDCTGAAHVYEKLGGVWTEVDRLIPSDADGNTRLGGDSDNGVQLLDGRILIGAPGDPTFGTGSGAAYVFEFDASNTNGTPTNNTDDCP